MIKDGRKRTRQTERGLSLLPGLHAMLETDHKLQGGGGYKKGKLSVRKLLCPTVKGVDTCYARFLSAWLKIKCPALLI